MSDPDPILTKEEQRRLTSLAFKLGNDDGGFLTAIITRLSKEVERLREGERQAIEVLHDATAERETLRQQRDELARALVSLECHGKTFHAVYADDSSLVLCDPEKITEKARTYLNNQPPQDPDPRH